jgi:hypothetical protein
MTPEDLDLSSRTPDITARSFRTLIGGDSYLERPQSKECTLCINRDAQPYAPHSPGESGLVLIYPDIVLREVGEDTSQTFNLFLNKNPTLSRKEGERQIQYLGTYTKVPIVHAKLEPNEWRSLPAKVSGILQHLIPSTLLVRLFLMAHCSAVQPGYVVFILQ